MEKYLETETLSEEELRKGLREGVLTGQFLPVFCGSATANIGVRQLLDAIEDEVGRPINFHSYVSGVAGPEIAVLFAEEGVNGAH